MNVFERSQKTSEVGSNVRWIKIAVEDLEDSAVSIYPLILGVRGIFTR